MRLAKNAFVIALTMLILVFTMSAQTLRSDNDPRNTAPTVGTGGPPGGPTGLFTVYDGQTLRKGEFTFSIAYSNFDRDPGNADFTEVPISFQMGLNDYLELFFNTDAYRAVKINSPRNLSGFYLPNSGVFQSGLGVTRLPAIVLAPRGPGTPVIQGAIFRPANAPFAPFQYDGHSAGNYGFFIPPGALFGFGAGTTPTLGPPRAGGGNGADHFPGVGSVYGSILPGLVLRTVSSGGGNCPSTSTVPNCQVPTVFTLAPSYLPDAPFINREYGESALSTFTVGAKWRFTGPSNPIGVGVIPFYRFYADKANELSGFNQLQRGASPGGGRGDIGVIFFADARVRKWMNISGNIGYIYNSSVKGDFINGKFTMLDRPDELLSAVAVDFPVNRYFQLITEFRALQYVGGRTPNAFENNPLDGIFGARIFPTRWFSMGAAYRYHFNQQDRDSFDGSSGNLSTTVGGTLPQTITTSWTGVPPGFQVSTDPHGFIVQMSVGRRNKRLTEKVNPPANVDGVTLGETRVTTPCPPGYRPAEGSNCSDDMSVSVTTRASDPDNDVLTYNYTVSGGRIVGQGANVSWDLTGVQPGTYTVTVGVDDGCGVCGTTKTETITVAACNCVPIDAPCVCPTVSVDGPSSTTEPGESMTFTANVSGGSDITNITYSWSVSAGSIESGQGTPVITVRAPSDGTTNVTASVDVGGLCKSCPGDSETAPVATVPEPYEVDEFGPLVNDDVKARIQNFYLTQLNPNPTAQGYIINYGTPQEIARREKQIRDAIAFLKYDRSRVTIVNGGANTEGTGVRTKLWVVPAGATPPTP